MSRESEIAMEHALSPGIAKDTGRRLYPRTMRLSNWPTVFTSHEVGKKVTRWKTGCAQNSNSCTTTRNCEAKSKRQDALKWRRSSERIIYETPKTGFGAGMSHVRHAAGTG